MLIRPLQQIQCVIKQTSSYQCTCHEDSFHM